MSLEIINVISNVFIAIGTVGAVIVALWLSYNDSKPRLKTHAFVGVITPEMKAHLWLSCTNVGKQPIMCTGLVFKPNKFIKTEKRIMPNPKIALYNVGQKLPVQLSYSEKVDQHFSDEFFSDTTIKNFLSPSRWIVKIQLKFCWRVVATTNIKNFEGKLSSCLIEKLLVSHFPRNKESSRKK